MNSPVNVLLNTTDIIQTLANADLNTNKVPNNITSHAFWKDKSDENYLLLLSDLCNHFIFAQKSEFDQVPHESITLLSRNLSDRVKRIKEQKNKKPPQKY